MFDIADYTSNKIRLAQLPHQKMSDEDFLLFCQLNDPYDFEIDKHGNIIILAPMFSKPGSYNSRLITELGIWNKHAKT